MPHRLREAYIKANIGKGSAVFIHGRRGYSGLQGAAHKTVKQSMNQYIHDMTHTNCTASVWAVPERGCHGIYHHFTAKHLQRDVDESAFRLNEDNVRRYTMARIDQNVVPPKIGAVYAVSPARGLYQGKYREGVCSIYP